MRTRDAIGGSLGVRPPALPEPAPTALLGVDDSAEGALLLRMAAGRLAIQYLERAGEWAADVDQHIVPELEDVRRRLLDRVETLSRRHGAAEDGAGGPR